MFHIYAVLISEAQTLTMDVEIVNRIETLVMHLDHAPVCRVVLYV